MRRFRFRLVRLERLRLQRRRESEIELAGALGKLADCSSRCEDRRRSLAVVEREWGDVTRRRESDWDRIRNAAMGLEFAREGLAYAQAAVRVAKEELRVVEERLVERSREHRVLEKLRGRLRARWLEQNTRDEQRFLDELHLVTREAARSGRETLECEDRSVGS